MKAKRPAKPHGPIPSTGIPLTVPLPPAPETVKPFDALKASHEFAAARLRAADEQRRERQQRIASMARHAQRERMFRAYLSGMSLWWLEKEERAELEKRRRYMIERCVAYGFRRCPKCNNGPACKPRGERAVGWLCDACLVRWLKGERDIIGNAVVFPRGPAVGRFVMNEVETKREVKGRGPNVIPKHAMVEGRGNWNGGWDNAVRAMEESQ